MFSWAPAHASCCCQWRIVAVALEVASCGSLNLGLDRMPKRLVAICSLWQYVCMYMVYGNLQLVAICVYVFICVCVCVCIFLWTYITHTHTHTPQDAAQFSPCTFDTTVPYVYVCLFWPAAQCAHPLCRLCCSWDLRIHRPRLRPGRRSAHGRVGRHLQQLPAQREHPGALPLGASHTRLRATSPVLFAPLRIRLRIPFSSAPDTVVYAGVFEQAKTQNANVSEV